MSIPRLLAFALAVGIASAAAVPSRAEHYLLTGRFTSHQGRLIDLPLAGLTPCPSLTVMSGTAMTGPANAFGCVPHGLPVEIDAKSVGADGTFLLPAIALEQARPETPNWLSFQNALPLLQIQTSLTIQVPHMSTLLRADAWTQQAGRAGASFTWCLGNPACTKASQGTQRAIVRYTAGATRYGATMQALILAGADSRIVRGAGLGGAVTFLPLVAGGLRPTGAGYAVAKTDPAVSGSAWAMYMASSMGRITMGTGYLGPRPGATAMHVGFPFTTGRVLVRRTGTQLGNPATSTLSAVGANEVTPAGARNMSLVAGSLSTSALGGPSFGLAQLALPEPSAAMQQLAAVVALLAVAARHARS